MQTTSRNKHGLADQFADWANLSWKLFFTATRTLTSTRFFLHTAGKLRRFSLIHFRKDYVHDQLLVRQGECRQCGTCCNLLFTCPMLTKQGRCLAYATCRPQACKVFPIDQRDIGEAETCGTRCGYHFINSTPGSTFSDQKD